MPQRIVLLEPPYVFWDREMDRIRQGEESVTGWGVLVLAAVAQRNGHEVAIVDAKGGGITLEEATARVTALRPDVLGISATTISIHNGARIAAAVKEKLPHVTTVVGGPHVSAVPEPTLERFPEFDYGVSGEGPATSSASSAATPTAACTRAVGRRTSTTSTACPSPPGTSSATRSRTASVRRSSTIGGRRSRRS
jgi:hypothetical protein